jgi:ABC-type transport system involved in multi-copper enzyme maturation permease subunit
MTIILIASVIVFDYLLPYVQLHHPALAAPGVTPFAPTDFYPGSFLRASIAMVPTLSLVALIAGAMSAGGEYSFGTLKATLTQGPSHTSSFFGQFAALGYLLFLWAILIFAVGALTSIAFALYDASSLAIWPSALSILAALLATWLVFLLLAAAGVLFAHLFRQAAPAIGFGIGYIIAVEALVVHYLLGLNPTLDAVLRFLPFLNAQSLIAAFSPTPLGSQILVHFVDAPRAALTLVIYLVVFLLVGARLLKRRDVF